MFAPSFALSIYLAFIAPLHLLLAGSPVINLEILLRTMQAKVAQQRWHRIISSYFSHRLPSQPHQP